MRLRLAVFFLASISLSPTNAYADDWSNWYSISDGYQNKILVRFQKSSIKASDGRADTKYQFKNTYKTRVSFHYTAANDANVLQNEGVEELGAGEESFEGRNVHRTNTVWINVSDVHKAGSHSLPPE